MLFSTLKKAGLLLSSLILIVSIAGCSAETESDPFSVPFSNGPDGAPEMIGPDGPPPVE